MGMAAILFSSAKLYNKLLVLLDRKPHVKSETGKWFHKRHLKIYTIVYMYKA